MEGCVASSSTRPCIDEGRVLLDVARAERELRRVPRAAVGQWPCLEKAGEAEEQSGTWGCAHPLQPAVPPGEGSKDGATRLHFTPAGSKPEHSESLVSVPAGGGRNKLATRSRK